MTDFTEYNQTITLTIPTQGSIPVVSISNWIIFMQRNGLNGFNWNLTWNDYKNGFGSSGSEDFWMGLERLHLLTTSGSYRLRLEWQEAVTGYWFSVEYWLFYIEDEAAYYKLHVSGYIPGDDGRVLCVYETAFYLARLCVKLGLCLWGSFQFTRTPFVTELPNLTGVTHMRLGLVSGIRKASTPRGRGPSAPQRLVFLSIFAHTL